MFKEKDKQGEFDEEKLNDLEEALQTLDDAASEDREKVQRSLETQYHNLSNLLRSVHTLPRRLQKREQAKEAEKSLKKRSYRKWSIIGALSLLSGCLVSCMYYAFGKKRR